MTSDLSLLEKMGPRASSSMGRAEQTAFEVLGCSARVHRSYPYGIHFLAASLHSSAFKLPKTSPRPSTGSGAIKCNK